MPPIHIRSTRLARLVFNLAWVICVTWGGLLPCLTAQKPAFNPLQRPSQEQDVAELPANAIWRNGQFKVTDRFNGIYRLAFSPDGKLLAARDQEMLVKVIDVNTQETLCEIEGHEQIISSIQFSPDSQLLLTAAGAREQVKIWDARTGKLKGTIDTLGYEAYFNTSGNRIHVLGEQHVETYSWPGTQSTEKKVWRSGKENRIGMSPDGHSVLMYRLLSRNVYQTLLMDLESRSKVQLQSPTLKPKSCEFSPDRNWLAVNFDRESNTCLWDLRDPHSRNFVLEGHDSSVQSLAFSRDSRYLLTTSWDDTAILWDVLTQEKIGHYKGHLENVNSSAFAPFDFRFATGASGRTDNSIVLWDYRNRVELPIDTPVENFEVLWETLGHKEYTPAMVAVSRLVQQPEQWLPEVIKKVELKTSGGNSITIAELIAQLDSAEYFEREHAVAQLIKIRVQADAQIQLALETATSPEVRMRLRRVLKQKIDRTQRDPVAERRWMRLIFALEQVNTGDSQALLERIANGHDDIDISRSARDSFDRNRARPTE